MSKALLASYEQQREDLPPTLVDSVSATLFQCLLAVDETSGKGKNADQSDYEAPNSVIVGNKVVKLPVTGPNPTFTSLLKAPPASVAGMAEGKDILVGSVDDDLRFYRSARMAKTSTYRYLDELEAFEHRALVRRQAPFLMRDGFCLAAETSESRGVDESELMTFTSLAHEEWYRLHKLQEAHDLLQSVNKPLPAFTEQQEKSELMKAQQAADQAAMESKVDLEADELPSGEEAEALMDGPVTSLVMNRTLYRSFSALGFSQALTAELVKEPRILKRYYRHTDELLMLLAWPAPERRMGCSTWAPNESITTAKAMQLLGNSGEKYRQDTLTLYPTGKAVVLARQMNSTGGAWVTFYLDGSSFGLRHVDDLSNKERSRSERADAPERPTADGDEESKAGDDASVSAGGEEGSTGAAGEEGDGEEKEEGGEEAAAAAAAAVEGEEEEEEELTEEEKEERAQAEAARVAEELAKKKEAARLAQEAKERAAKEAKPSVFSYCGADGVRINVIAGPSPEPVLKPDKLGTVAMSITDTEGLRVTACSNGVIRIADVPLSAQQASGDEGLGVELSRTVCNMGTVTRALCNGPYSRDILSTDGTRTLVRDPTFDFKTYRQVHPDRHNHSSSSSSKRAQVPKMPGFHEKFLAAAPQNWRYARLDPAGEMVYLTNEPGEGEKTTTVIAAADMSPLFKNIRKHCFDAETGAGVSSFMDGRVIVEHVNQVTDLAWPDGTRMVMANGAVLYLTKLGLPTIECDLEIEEMCSGHSKGKQVTLSKGGLRVRSRIALNDGSAVMIKYDTRITATENGSLKLVRRDRSVITATDAGLVEVIPKQCWDVAAAAVFADECKDTYAPTAAVAAIGDVEKSVSIVEGETQVAAPPAPSMEVTTSLVAEASSATAKTMPPPVGPGADALTVLNTSYKFFINAELVEVEDDEYNRFQVRLADVLNPDIDLAGEVQGLKPVAITERPLDPRLFIVSRDGDATEVVSEGMFNDWMKHSRDCEDVACTRAVVADVLTTLSPDTNHQHQIEIQMQQQSNDVAGGPSGGPSAAGGGGEGVANGGPSIADEQSAPSQVGAPGSVGALPLPLQSFCFQRRRRLNIADDRYTFQEVFGLRRWQQKPLPAVASMDRKLAQAREEEHKQHAAASPVVRSPRTVTSAAAGNIDTTIGGASAAGNGADVKVLAIPPRVSEILTLTQKAEARTMLHKRVSDEYAKWTAFLTMRESSIDRFDVTDYRPQEEQDQEAALAVKLEAMYKALKKKAKQDRVRAANANAAMDAGPASPSKSEPVPGPAESQELMDLSINSDDGSDTIARKNEKKNVVPVLELELNAAFLDFGNEEAAVLEVKDLRDALVQVLNTYVSGDIIEAAVWEITPHLLQEGANGSGIVQGARLVVAAPEAEVTFALAEPPVAAAAAASGSAVIAEPVSLQPSMQAGVQPSGSLFASQVGGGLAQQLPPIIGAAQGMTRTEFGAIYDTVCRLMREEEHSQEEVVATPAAMDGGGEGGVGYIEPESVGMPRSQSEPAGVAMNNNNNNNNGGGGGGEGSGDGNAMRASNDGFPGGGLQEPSQVSAWGAMEQQYSIAEQSVTGQVSAGSRAGGGGGGGVGSGSVEASQASLERLSKTAPGKPQNQNQHWFPETEDILNTSPSKAMGGTQVVPQGSARAVVMANRR